MMPSGMSRIFFVTIYDVLGKPAKGAMSTTHWAAIHVYRYPAGYGFA